MGGKLLGADAEVDLVAHVGHGAELFFLSGLGGVQVGLEGAFFLQFLDEGVAVENGEGVVGDGDGRQLIGCLSRWGEGGKDCDEQCAKSPV